jgi:membrane protein DedA with SNARE-associated domain
MFPIISFIKSYGYLAVFAGAIFEGESIVLIGGLSSHEEYLSFVLVVFFAILGAIAGDWFFFFLGRNKKEVIYNRFPRLARLADTPKRLIEKRPRLISFGMRFMYGFRHIVPMSIGASAIPARQFLFWNTTGAISWAIVMTTAGYIAGDILEVVFRDIKQYEFRIIVLTVVVIVIFSAVPRVARIFLSHFEK